jgi:hypothetical protein
MLLECRHAGQNRHHATPFGYVLQVLSQIILIGRHRSALMYDIEAFSATPNPTDKHSDYLGEKTLFESSAILPVQCFPSRRAKPEMEPERRLAFAVLADAVRCFQLNLGAEGRRKNREFAEAQSWLFETTDDGPFSFDSVCYLLELHPASLRRALRQWQAMKVAGVSSRSLVRRSSVNRRALLHQNQVAQPKRRLLEESA